MMGLCVSWPMDIGHMDCEVVVRTVEDQRRQAVRLPGPFPRVCSCECKTCKRAWWERGRPVVRDGKVVTGNGATTC